MARELLLHGRMVTTMNDAPDPSLRFLENSRLDSPLVELLDVFGFVPENGGADDQAVAMFFVANRRITVGFSIGQRQQNVKDTGRQKQEAFDRFLRRCRFPLLCHGVCRRAI